MKVLHTADWHLGQRLCGRDREEEHQRFLRWLMETIRERGAQLLLVAGDIFDTPHPNHSSVQLYYDFLRDLAASDCQAIIVAGNHDSPAQLNAPRQLLRRLNIHVVGSPSSQHVDDVILISPSSDSVEQSLAVCAIPFLRERDLTSIIVGERGQDREERMRLALRQHFSEMRLLAEPYRQRGWPILATGHLAIQGSARSEEDKELYLGHLGTINGSHLPGDFDYLALGHLHQAHEVAGNTRMRYAGSPLPVSFAEAHHEKRLVLLEFEQAELADIQWIAVPIQRRLHRFVGTLSTLRKWLRDLPQSELASWLEITFSPEEQSLEASNLAGELAAEAGCEALKIIAPEKPVSEPSWAEGSVSLKDLSPMDVFEQRCRQEELVEEASAQLRETFAELLALHEARILESPRPEPSRTS